MMTTAEKLAKVYENTEKVAELNDELEQILYGTDTGGKSYYDEFWDAYQDNGNRTFYLYAFAYIYANTGGWDDASYNPKYPIICASNTSAARGMFLYNHKITDTKVEIVVKNTTLKDMFYEATKLKTIRLLTLQGATAFADAFRDCSALESLTISGEIAVNGFNVQWSTQLNKSSWISIVNALSETTTGLTITGSLASVNKAFETSEGANDGSTSTEWTTLINTRKNWTISLV